MVRLIPIVAGIACACAAAVMATASTIETPAARPGVDVARCVTRAATTVALAEPAAVDRIVVEVAAGSPEEGAADVRVQTGASARVVHVFGAASRSLEFYPALVGQSFAVAIDSVSAEPEPRSEPGGDEPAGACVQRILLMHRGALVSEVVP
jgi:hypothetical protein